MEEYIAFDSHKRYTLARVDRADGRKVTERRIEHRPGAISKFLSNRAPGSPVAVETIGNWYWIVGEIEAAGMRPRLVHAGKAKVMMGQINKTDKLDAQGLNVLQRTGALPEVWIPPAQLRDLRELTRGRMVLVGQRTQLKNRIHAVLARYGLQIEGISDLFGPSGRRKVDEALGTVPPQTRYVSLQMLKQIDHLTLEIRELENRLEALFSPNEQVMLLRSMPGVGPLLSVVIWLELGEAARFASAERFSSYCGLVPRVFQSGQKRRYGATRPDVNRYLKWAFVEAANVVSLHRKRWKGRHAVGVYERVRSRTNHAKAVVAVAHHLAEAAWWMLHKKEEYRERGEWQQGGVRPKGL